MELLIRLIEFLVRSAVEGNRPRTTGAPPIAAGARLPTASQPAAQQRLPASSGWGQPGMQPTRGPAPHTHSTQSSSAPVTAMKKAAAQDPAYDDGGWRSAVLIFALIALAILVIMWLAVMGKIAVG
jgi:hypothetical protein